MSSNVKTTPVLAKPEFWMTLVTSVSGLLLAFGVITPDQAKGIEAYVPNIIGGILSLLSTFKFVNTQHAAKVEVFKAMCAASMQLNAIRRADGGVSAQSASAVEDDVAKLARATGI